MQHDQGTSENAAWQRAVELDRLLSADRVAVRIDARQRAL